MRKRLQNNIRWYKILYVVEVRNSPFRYIDIIMKPYIGEGEKLT